MGRQKYRADKADPPCGNGAIAWFSSWIGGPTLALVRNCPTPFGPRTVYATGEADTWFSIPAKCSVKGKTITGFLTREDGEWAFRAHTNR